MMVRATKPIWISDNSRIRSSEASSVVAPFPYTRGLAGKRLHFKDTDFDALLMQVIPGSHSLVVPATLLLGQVSHEAARRYLDGAPSPIRPYYQRR
jgi:hypothetical protein